MQWINQMISGRWCKVVRIFAKLSNGIDNDKVSSANFRHLVSRLSLNQVVGHFHLVLLVALGFVPSSCCIFLWKLLKHYVTVDSIYRLGSLTIHQAYCSRYKMYYGSWVKIETWLTKHVKTSCKNLTAGRSGEDISGGQGGQGVCAHDHWPNILNPHIFLLRP